MLRLVIALVFAFVPAIASAQVKVVIDPGHGGTDSGGTGLGRQEKIIVLDVSKKFETLLKADTADTAGGGTWTALLTRSTDVFVSLAGRSQYSNNQGADRFMSIHANAFADASANGIETFSLAATGTSATLRNLVQAEMVAAWGLTNRGNKIANFAVLRDTAAPAVLHELAFITNATDSAKLASDTERQKAAVAHLRALQRSYNQAPYLPTTTPQDVNGEIAGTVVGASGPIEGATVALDGGTSVTTDADGVFVLGDVPPGPQTIVASAAGHAQKSLNVTVAAAARQDVTIELSEQGGGGGGEEEGPDSNGAIFGGCATSNGAGGACVPVLLAFAAMRRRRRVR